MLAERNVGEEFVRFAAADDESSLTRPINLESSRRGPVLQHTIVVPIDQLAYRRAKIDNLAFRRAPIISSGRSLLANVHARDKAEFGAKARTVIGVIVDHDEMTAGVGKVRVQSIALLRGSVDVRGGASRELKILAELGEAVILARPTVRRLNIADPILAELQASVERNDAVAGVGKIASGSKRSDVRLFSKLALHAHHAVHRARVERAARRLILPGFAIINGQSADSPRADFAGHASAKLRIHDLP